jgi:histidyl-tRNA synthetase
MGARIKALRGMNDVLPAQTPLWRFLFETVQQVMDSYGYQEIKLPVIEATELFKRAVGEVTDVVEKEMFTFLDREKSSMSLRPEGTAGCVRAGIEHGLLHNQRQYLWYAGPMFRHERPQAGRYRQFHQVGVEVYGTKGPTTDVEVIALSARLWKKLGINGLTLELNSLGTPASRQDYRAALVAFLEKNEDKLDEDSKRRLNTNPLRVLDSKDLQTRELLKSAPVMSDYLDIDSKRHFTALKVALEELGISYVLNPKLVRGLDYYNRTVFEWTTDQLGSQATVCAGGRYDGLVGQLGGGEVPAVGFALGVERLVLLLEKQGTRKAEVEPHVYFCWNDSGNRPRVMKLAEDLRDQGIRVRLNHNAKYDLKKQLKSADKSGAVYALIVLDDPDIPNSSIQVKSLRNDSQQISCGWPELSGRLAGLLGLTRPNT